ncbi:MAG: hypothetical protein GQF41_2048 [Candidatus Rifleibacterium amylolyticum]|nr:MAG: hypothetical protein GQF41_2048 [Candidatus Rifleibacterium amylolyticum]NLF97431.1 hypothetical protein [Candidatus Riflebacteria bacterium]
MENNGRRNSFGFNVKPDLSEYRKKEPEPVENEEATEGKEPVAEGEKVSELLKDATVGLVHSTRDLILYIIIWYLAYPFLFFTSFHMAQKYLQMKFDSLSPIELLNMLITIGAGVYYAYYMLATFINEHTAPQVYEDEKRFFFPRLGFYALYMGFVLYNSNMLNVETFENSENIRLFVVFYILYISSVTLFRHFNARVSKPR